MNYKKLIKMYLDNVPVSEMAASLKCSTATIYATTNKLRKAGVILPMRPKVYSPFTINAKDLNEYIKSLQK